MRFSGLLKNIKERKERKERQLSFDFSASYSHMILPTCKRVVVVYQQPILSSPVKSQDFYMSSVFDRITSSCSSG